jgi:hypothetical protein
MMPGARRASLVLVVLLASAGTATAECAWVLWQHQGRPLIPRAPGARRDTPVGSYSFSWVVEGAYATEAACKAEVRLWDTMPGKRDGAYAVTADDTKVRVICLPDTIDPRGPKGR